MFMIAAVPAAFLVGYLLPSGLVAAAIIGTLDLGGMVAFFVGRFGFPSGTPKAQVEDVAYLALQALLFGTLPTIFGSLARRKRFYQLATSTLLLLQLCAAVASGFRVDASSTWLGLLALVVAVATFCVLNFDRLCRGHVNVSFLASSLMASVVFYLVYSSTFRIAAVAHY